MNKLGCEGVRLAREPLLLTLPEVAKALSVATRTVRRLIERGELPKVKVGRCVRVPAEALLAWVDKEVMHAHNKGRAGSGVRGKEVNACQSAETDLDGIYERSDSPCYWASYTDASGARVRCSTGIRKSAEGRREAESALS